jgi:hypothetical protein
MQCQTVKVNEDLLPVFAKSGNALPQKELKKLQNDSLTLSMENANRT